MAGSVNKVILIGNLGADPEVRSFQNGGQVCNLRIATSENWRDKQYRRAPRAHRVAQRRHLQRRADRVAQRYLKKGSKVYIEGQIQTRKWQDQSGQDRYTTEIVVGALRRHADHAGRPRRRGRRLRRRRRRAAAAGGGQGGGRDDMGGGGGGRDYGGSSGGLDDEIPF